jgi:hypothetical protein
MSSIINSDDGAVSGSAGLKTDAGTPGNLVLQTNGVAAVTISNDQSVSMPGNLTVTSTGFMQMPVGTTAQRPSSPAAGMYRMNTTTLEPEWYDAVGGAWTAFSQRPTYAIEYLVVAGGGSGNNGWINDGSTTGGGGGGGGMRSGTLSVETALTYAAIVGAGGAWTFVEETSAPGADSSFSTIASIGGGGGGKQSRQGGPGGSGGGGGGGAGATNGGAGTIGQGTNGGNGTSGGAGGGGGAGGAGGMPTAGAGLASSIIGSSVTYAAGGQGGTTNSGNGVAGAANTGNGARGAQQGSGAVGANGGSGIVIIRYAGAQRGTGGTITSEGGYTIHTFTSSGTFTA